MLWEAASAAMLLLHVDLKQIASRLKPLPTEYTGYPRSLFPIPYSRIPDPGSIHIRRRFMRQHAGGELGVVVDQIDLVGEDLRGLVEHDVTLGLALFLTRQIF